MKIISTMIYRHLGIDEMTFEEVHTHHRSNGRDIKSPFKSSMLYLLHVASVSSSDRFRKHPLHLSSVFHP